MYLQQKQLFWGVSQDFLKQVMSVSTSVSYLAEEIVFRKNDPADWFYILIKGRIKICPNDIEGDGCCGECTGEVFGWDSLTEHRYYRSSAICVEPATLLKLSRQHMDSILNEDPYSAALFFRHLASALGNCLMERWKEKAVAKDPGEKPEVHALV